MLNYENNVIFIIIKHMDVIKADSIIHLKLGKKYLYSITVVINES